MRHKTHHLFYLFRKTYKASSANLFYPRSLVSLRRSGPVSLCKNGWITIVLLLFATTVTAQETPPTPDKFYVGTEFQNQTLTNLIFYPPFYESGMNTLSQRADNELTWSHIKDYNILAANIQNKTDWIAHYTTCYYSKWEAEVDAEADRVGFKHRDSLGYLIGNSAAWKGKLCWSSSGLSQPRDSLIYGPHYRQDKRYKRWLYEPDQKDSVKYIPRFTMALDNHGNVNPNEDVCRIKVVFRYRIGERHYNYTFPIERILKVGDFNTSGEFDEFYLHPDQELGWYLYPNQFWLPENIDNFPDVPSSIEYFDCESYTGIQYCVDWLGNDELFTLYIDYVEVYDNNGWNDFITQPNETAQLITDYAQNYNNQAWQNIKYWLGVDEPYSIDCYEPIRVVDSLIRTVNPNAPLIVPFNPTWHWLNKINGEDEVLQFYNRANPDELPIGFLPIDLNFMRSYSIESLKRRIYYEMK